MEPIVYSSLCAAVAGVPKREPSTSSDDQERGLCLVLTGVGSYLLAFAADGTPTAARADSTIAANALGTIVTDVHTLLKLADGSWSPLRAVTSGHVKFSPSAAKASAGSRSRVDQRQSLGPWVAALKRAGLVIRKAVDSGLHGAGKVVARVASERDDVAGKAVVTRYIVTVSVQDEHSKTPQSRESQKSAASVCWEREKTYEDFAKLRKQLEAAKVLAKVEAAAPFPQEKKSSFKSWSLPRSIKVADRRESLDAWIQAVAMVQPMLVALADFLDMPSNTVPSGGAQPEDVGELSRAGVQRVLGMLPTFNLNGFEGRKHLLGRIGALENELKAANYRGLGGWASVFVQGLSWAPRVASFAFSAVAAQAFVTCLVESAAAQDDVSQITSLKMIGSVGILAVQSARCAGIAVLLCAATADGVWGELYGTVLTVTAARSAAHALKLFIAVVTGRFICHVWIDYGFKRAIHVYSVACIVIGLYVWLKLLFKVLRLDANQTAPLYQRVDMLLAPFVAGQFVALKSVWVKIGQYVSGRTDITPALWQEAFAIMQSDMPSDSIHEIDATLQDAFPGKKIADLFEEFDYVPLASASIAQVHRARLYSGQAVAVKIQHAGVAAVFLADMARSIKIARVCAWLNSDFETMLTVLTSWEKEIHFELDFEHEVANIRLIRAALLDKHGANVCVPAVINALVSKRVFAMEFIEDSFKIDDFQLSYHGVNKLELMRLVVHVWCTMLFRVNAVNADPHPGNLHVRLSSDGTVQPVLLDWGWVVRLSPGALDGWRGLVVALSEMDVSGASKALQALGYRNNQDDRAPERSVEFFAYLMRDTSGIKEAKKESKEFFEDRKVERDDDKNKGVREKGGRKMQAVPESFIFVTRVLGLLRGLCATLDVELPLIEIMACHARLGQLEAQEDNARKQKVAWES